ncbi:4-hydroxyphenylpyruvate dioxygenase [Tistlia consotensis]|uniref:3-dehydroshikimate dehydratase n=1 Tax=Tistlia consotensis USBA 355 TaxID=560819 RepID=A0A1Y6C8V1_9PROT|nr:bifunctional sugar phosphate isomerase/epimerase/4-hydroxyphenylpyruvate dioxygenase family protein [Tistlia consotensis]SMF51941.1 4-hydroxyphenylpyruvate dioxygenase [Tistlia consotensis USBA 355]SNR83564.1 4-hydroxyphenylpyruvate dioxygenase [Tistlia consotensis]
MHRTSIATVSLSGDLREKLDAIAAAGFDGVEIFENDFLAYPAGAAEVGRLVREAGLAVTVFQPFRDFEGLPEPQRGRAFERAERKFDVMQALGTDLMLVCSNVSPAALGGIDRAAEDFRELGERAARRGLRIGYEALAWGRHVSDHRDAWEIVRRADHPAVGLVLDSFHTLAPGLDPETIRRIPGDRIFLVQVADAPKLEMDLLSWSRHFRCMPGQGQLDVAGFLAAVEATGYAGYLSLEIFNDQFRAGSARQVAVDGRRSLIAVADQVARSAGRTDGLLPARARPLGVEFVEFAVDEPGAEQLAELFAALGFACAGRHVSKAVEWWREGGINLVVNAEKEGFAHASWLTHGPGVCAVGLQVEDAGAAMERARALLAQPFSQPVGPGELEVPAIRGVGGSLLYFTDPKSELARVWEIEFRPADRPGAPARKSAGLTRIDHVSQSMEYDEMLSWLLFYTSIFEMERTPELDIADPGGLVRSQVVESADKAVRIPLNGTQSHRTLAARFLSEFFGSGVQHIAFASSDIFASAAALEANGVALLQVPDNYYDDLEARFGLEPELLERLSANAVLFDRDEAGDYFQLYTRPFQERFFFEIVERRGTYAGFGAANAPIRLAAQSLSARHPAVPRR